MSYRNTRVQVPKEPDGRDSRGNDSATLKLPRRGVVDDDPTVPPSKTRKLQKKDGEPLVSHDRLALIGTFNIRTAREAYKRLELVTQFLESGMEILGIQEHRIVHQEPIRIEKFKKGVTLVTISAWRNGAGAATGGVGFLLTSRAFEVISLIKPYGSRVLTISFNGNPRLTTVTAYSPTEAAPAEEAEDFHNTLRQAMADVPAHHLLITNGDMNARLGKESDDDPRWYFHSCTNRNGELLRDTALECDMEISNIRFRKRESKMWTHLSDGTLNKGQLDFVLIRRKWRNSLKNTEAYNTFQSLGSDHRVVVSKVKVSFRCSRRPPKRVHYDYSALKVDTELQNKYAVEVQNRFSCLVEEDDEATVSYGKFVEAIDATNKSLLPKKTRQRQLDPASDPRVDSARRELFLAKDEYHQEPCEEKREEVATKKDLLKSCYAQVEEEILKRKIKRVEETADRCKNKESWNLVNDITGRTKSSCGLVEGGSSAERLENWKKHFSGLLGQPPRVPNSDITIRTVHPPQDIEEGPFTLEELQLAKKQIVEGKAFGDDGIAPEVMKRVDIDDIILKFCNSALRDGNIPDQWRLSNIIPVPKKGDLTKTDNYRGISLTSIVSKTLNRMLLNRIKPSLEETLRNNQNGFRPGRSTTSHILALRRIIEGVKAKNLKATMVFIDFKKAFDSVHRGLLMKILRAYGIPDAIVQLISRLYTGTKAKVVTADGITEVFDILAGVLQGDTLAPYLFIIVVDYIMTVAIDDVSDPGFTLKPARSRRVAAEKLADVEFADDVALVTDTMDEAKLLLDRLESAALSVGLAMNDSKTKFISFNTPEEECTLTSSTGNVLEHVEDFIYLGSWIATTERDFRVRKAKAWAACHKLKKIWKSNLRRSLKIRLFVATVESILLYGSEAWTLTESLKKRIDGCYTRMLRMALNIDWKLHKTNKEVYGSLPRATMKIQERRMRLAGHIHRHPELVANRLLLWEPTHGTRSRGRPATTFVDNLRTDTGLTDTGEIGRLMADRLLWRQRIDTRTLRPP